MRLFLILFTTLLSFAQSVTSQVVLVNAGFNSYGENVGGKDEFRHIFEHEVWLPDELVSSRFDTTVKLAYSILPDGTLGEMRLITSGGEIADNEARRIMGKLEFIPAVFNGSPSESHHEIEMRFHAKKIAKLYKQRGYEKAPFKKQVSASHVVHVKPEIPATFPGGPSALGQFIAKNLRYPVQASSASIEGNVELSFVVEPNGYASNIRVTRSLGAGCDQEAIRVARLIRWEPASSSGELVRSRVTLPIQFRLNLDLRNNVSTEQKTY